MWETARHLARVEKHYLSTDVCMYVCVYSSNSVGPVKMYQIKPVGDVVGEQAQHAKTTPSFIARFVN